MNIREKLISLSILKQGDWFSMYQVLNEDISLSILEDEVVKFHLSQLGSVGVLTILDEGYPDSFRDMSMPPLVLFYRGDIRLLKQKKIGIIGGKRASDYGVKACQRMIPALVNADCAIIGGLQPGIETVAYQLSMKKGKNIAILSSGLNCVYSKENQDLYQQLVEGHLVLTEYPLQVCSSWRQYYRSYRLMQKLSDVIIVLEAPSADRRLIYLKHMIYEGKPVYVLPDRYDSLNSRGSLSLINEGARCFINSEEVLKNLEGE